jgi:hypothetical protein
MLRCNNWRRHTHWNKALKKTDLAPLTIHDVRHIYASLARKSPIYAAKYSSVVLPVPTGAA